MRILSKGDIRFEKGPTGVLNCRLKDGTAHERLHCITLFPLTLQGGFISVVKEVDQEVEEIGIISDLEGFGEDQKLLVRHSMDEHYFVPEILSIRKLSSRKTKKGHGFDEWEIETDRGRKKVYLFNPRENMAVSNAGIVIITDIEKNRYKISDVEKLPEESRQILEQITL